MKDDWETVSTPTKPLCINCRFCTYPDAPPTMSDLSIWAKCAADVETNLVDGSIKLQLCTYQRTALGKCKAEGILFKPSMGVANG